MEDIKTEIWRTPLREASERYLNNFRVKNCLTGNLVSGNVMNE
jgi:hypothetical protein